MARFFQERAASFIHAIHGIGFVLRTQPNSWIHALATAAALVVGVWVELSPTQWAILALTITAVWVAEFLNTAIEAVVDLVQPDHHPLAKAAKDTAAGAVLVSAIGSVVVGILILGPGFINHLFR
jgi:diacylglycerol kinase